MKKATAILFNKRKAEDGTYIVTTHCTECGWTEFLSFAGWTAKVCASCKSEMYRAPYRKDTTNSATKVVIHNVLRAWNENPAGHCKWDVYRLLFGLMDERKTTLRQICEIATEIKKEVPFAVDAETIKMRRRQFLVMRKGKK